MKIYWKSVKYVNESSFRYLRQTLQPFLTGHGFADRYVLYCFEPNIVNNGFSNLDGCLWHLSIWCSMADNWFLAGQWDHDPDHRMADQQVQLEKSLLNGNEHLPGWNDRLLCCTELFYIIDWPLSASCGVGISMPLLQNIMLSIFPPEKRGSAMGMSGIVIGLAPALGHQRYLVGSLIIMTGVICSEWSFRSSF